MLQHQLSHTNDCPAWRAGLGVEEDQRLWLHFSYDGQVRPKVVKRPVRVVQGCFVPGDIAGLGDLDDVLRGQLNRHSRPETFPPLGGVQEFSRVSDCTQTSGSR
jgi:hypothetical protein